MSITLQVCEIMGVSTPVKQDHWEEKVIPDPECANMLFVVFTPLKKNSGLDLTIKILDPADALKSEPPIVIAVGAFKVAKIWLNKDRVVAVQLWSRQAQQYSTSFVDDKAPDNWWISFLHNWAMDEGLLLTAKDEPLEDISTDQLKKSVV